MQDSFYSTARHGPDMGVEPEVTKSEARSLERIRPHCNCRFPPAPPAALTPPLWLESDRQRRRFAHQRDGDAAIGRDLGVVGK